MPEIANAGNGSSADSRPRISDVLGQFAEKLSYEDIPKNVEERAKHHIIDSVGIALASGTYEFSKRAENAIRRVSNDASSGNCTVIGRSTKFVARDAAFLNGLLIHGLDFDDTHPTAVLHASATALPTALAVAEERGLSGRDLLSSYVVGVEIACRLGMASSGGFHARGFHPTGILGAFASAVVASRLSQHSWPQIAAAQGFAGSLTSGSMEFLDTGAWTKRAHAGWAGSSGIVAAAFAGEGFPAPPEIYEGRYGLYRSYVSEREVDLDACTAGLGTEWEMLQMAIKPFPACHFTHAFADAALRLAEDNEFDANDVESVRCLIAEEEVQAVFEPLEKKQTPNSSYDAQFSVPFVVAAALAKRQFTLTELEDDVLTDPEVLAIAKRVTYETDPKAGFPETFSGEICIQLRGGKQLRHREQVNRGTASRPLSNGEITDKFFGNATRAVSRRVAENIIEAIENIDRHKRISDVTKLLRP